MRSPLIQNNRSYQIPCFSRALEAMNAFLKLIPRMPAWRLVLPCLTSLLVSSVALAADTGAFGISIDVPKDGSLAEPIKVVLLLTLLALLPAIVIAMTSF